VIHIDTRIQNRYIGVDTIIVNAINIEGRILTRKDSANALRYSLRYCVLEGILFLGDHGAMTEDKNIDHSRLLDVHRHSDYPEVNDFVNAFWEQHVAAYFKATLGKRGPKSKAMFKVLFLDLYVAWLEDPDLCVSFPRGDSNYKVDSRYNKLFISKDIKKVVDALLKQGFLDQKTGSEAAGKVTRIWPLEPLIEYFKTAGFPEFLIDIHLDKECIVLRDKAVEIGPDTKEISRNTEIEYIDRHVPFDIVTARERLQSYNALLRRTHIDLGSEETPVVSSEHYNRKRKRSETRRVSLRHDNKFVRRIFYRGDWALGGRYHGGWWQSIPSDLRKNILIDDQYTVEVDYSGFHIALAYGLEGHQPPEDPYDLSVTVSPLTKEQQRKDVKLLALTAINAEDRKSAYSAFRDQRNTDQRQLSKAEKISYTNGLLEVLLEEFLRQNQPIASYLCADKGVELMALDGQITTRIIKHFTDKGVPILTVHDSYIVQSQYERELMDAMRGATKTAVGDYRFKMKQDQPSPTMIDVFARMDNQINPTDLLKTLRDSVERTQGYQQRYQRFQRYLQEYH
jgi:hypothetical protein